jgi:hypothetical protein
MDVEKINSLIQQKTNGLKESLKSSIRSFNMKHVPSKTNTTSLINLTLRLKQQFGMINHISIIFKRSGIYRYKGVGRGTKADEVGNTKRTPAEWPDQPTDQFSEGLAEDLAEGYGDAATDIIVNSLKIK